ncbi:MAG: ABC transporter permease subunit [Chloroflexota bacterium]|nr:ABC transporter permease subunit [Chloroflexota bacterium]
MLKKIISVTNNSSKEELSTSSNSYRKIATLGVFGSVIVTALVVSVLIHMTIEDDTLRYPTNFNPELTVAIDASIQWAVVNGEWFFDGISDAVKLTLGKLQDFLIWIPWSVTVTLVFILAWRWSTFRIAIASSIGMMVIGFVNLWEPAMVTISIMVISVTIAILSGIPVGILMARSDFIEKLVRPVLDAMQTMPSFVYLVPGIMLFGLGNVGAILATVLYAIPPCIRLTNLGIRQVDPSVVEAGVSFGSTSSQLLFKVQIPMAIPTIMAGINQTVMMALAMSTIAAMVGAGGLGLEVLRAMGQLEEGKAFIAGTAIVVMAIIFDRISQGYILSKSN